MTIPSDWISRRTLMELVDVFENAAMEDARKHFVPWSRRGNETEAGLKAVLTNLQIEVKDG